MGCSVSVLYLGRYKELGTPLESGRFLYPARTHLSALGVKSAKQKCNPLIPSGLSKPYKSHLMSHRDESPFKMMSWRRRGT
ncbi:hypothetical protein DPMN_020984 [Dreissena polymorpha]|uniref:Uncharacterized protein n=1 Tax=Dreissena polymorpha TaxID=45954 RepID=A0A9D4SAP8_DREPO|nr:hypothetical protein DPMN_020984 [Dreissena polymorpha]